MNNESGIKKMTLKELVRTLAETAAYAQNTLHRDYEKELRGNGGRGFKAVPRPLCLADMRVSFAANVADGESAGFRGDGDICLEFGGGSGNFKGELVFRSSEAGPEAVCEYGDGGGPEECAGVAEGGENAGWPEGEHAEEYY